MTWKSDPKANAGYTVVVSHQKGGDVVASAKVAKGKAKATVTGLKPGKKLWVEVRPLRTSGGKTYSGVLHGTWAEAKSGASAKTQSTPGGALTAASV